MLPTIKNKLSPLLLGALFFGSLEACSSEEETPRARDRGPSTADDVDAPTDEGADDEDDDNNKVMRDAKAAEPVDAGTSVTEQPDAAVVVVDAATDANVVQVPPAPPFAIHVPPSPQPKGDVEKGYDYLVNGDYITLGMPWTGFSATMTPLEERDSIPGRTGDNAKTSYRYNVVTDADGVKMATPNCLSCHSTHMNGKVVIGLGHPNQNLGYQSSGTSSDIAGMLLRSSPAEAAAALRFTARMANAVRFGAMDVFPELASHHDPETLEWSDQNLFDADTGLVGGVDTPPWWRCKKKNGLYYTGVGRGQQSSHMSFMSVFSVRNAEEGRRIEDNFVHVGEFIRSIEPPKYPGTINQDLVAQGEAIFVETCATCHGTYGENWTYPNLVIPYQDVGTDPSLATDNWVNQATVDWFSGSFYANGGASWLENLPGYYAPPLDGVWATAPFFHNGSVPTLEGVIDPKKRPATWTASFGDDDYDLEHLGWKAAPGGLSLGAFNTNTPGNSNKGHTYGAGLDESEQKALLEYLKTL